MKNDKFIDHLYVALETELGGVQIYRAALACVKNPDLKKEWTKYLQQTEKHVAKLTAVFEKMGLDPDLLPPCRVVAKHAGLGLLKTIQLAQEIDPAGAEVVACECVVNAETKDHLNWELIGEALEEMTGAGEDALSAAYDEIEDEEDEHYYHSAGWCRELHLEALGLPAVLPPPEEEEDVKTMAEAADAKASRDSAKS